eukprot:gene595-8100_t
MSNGNGTNHKMLDEEVKIEDLSMELKENEYTVSEEKSKEVTQNFEHVKTILKTYTEEETKKRDKISEKLEKLSSSIKEAETELQQVQKEEKIEVLKKKETFMSYFQKFLMIFIISMIILYIILTAIPKINSPPPI